MSKTQTWIVMALLAIGMIPALIFGIREYMSATAKTLHPKAEEVPSVALPGADSKLPDAVANARKIVRTAMAEQNLPGVSVAVGVGGELVWAEGFGWADLDKRTPVTPETRFRIGTASIALTSAAVGLLVEQGKLKLEEPMRTYVPEFPRRDWPVTLGALMSHTAGIRNDGGDEGELYGQSCGRAAEALPHFADRKLLFEPGTEYRFSSYGWVLVSAAVENVTQEPLPAFMQKQVFGPLGMRDTLPDSLTEPVPNRATPYFPRYGSDPRYGLHDMRPVNYSCYSGASVFVSTPSDMVRFGMAMSTGTLLRRATVETLQTPHRLTSGVDTGYGLGWDLENVTLAGKPTRWVGHEGTVLGGPVASLMTFPEHGIVVAVTSNISYADAEGIALKVAEAFAAARQYTANRRRIP